MMSTSAFYVVVIDEDFSHCKEVVKVKISTIPMKYMFAIMKNVNYPLHILSILEAEEKGDLFTFMRNVTLQKVLI